MSGIADRSIESWPHGNVGRYRKGCRCDDCRMANRDALRRYRKRKRRGETDPLVAVDEVRRHVTRLSEQGIGYRTIADAAQCSVAVVQRAKRSDARWLRQSIRDRLLAVDEGCAADSALVDARPTLKLIRELLSWGYTRGAIALRLGCRHLALQLRGRRVEARTAQRIARIHRSAQDEVVEIRRLTGHCDVCEERHTSELRGRILLRFNRWNADRIVQSYSHYWSDTPGGRELLRRDWAYRQRRRAGGGDRRPAPRDGKLLTDAGAKPNVSASDSRQ